MKKIITAINNPKLNEELKKEQNFKIIGKDIQYKEAILEILEQKSDVDLIIINEKIPGEINLEILIKKIKLINEKIKIIFILEKENNELEKLLIKNNIIDIYYNNKINLKELIKIINKKEINMEEEIIKLKKIIEEKNINYQKIEEKSKKDHHFFKEKKQRKNKEKIKSLKENLIRVKDEIQIRKSKGGRKKNQEKHRNMSTKIITFSGNHKSGKTTISLIIGQCLAAKKHKVLLIDGDLEKQDLNFILNQGETESVGKFKRKRRNNKNNFRKNYIPKQKNYRTKKYKNNFWKKRKNFDQKKFAKEKRNKKELIKNKFNLKRKKIENKLVRKEYFLQNKNKRLINKKNNIYFYKIIDIKKKYVKKINRNLDLFYGLDKLLKNKKKISFITYNFLRIVKPQYDFIIIDLSKTNFKEINKTFLENSYLNFIFLEPNLLGLKEFQELYKTYKKEWRINENSLHVIENKKNILSINKKLIAKTISYKNKIFEIKENKFYYFCMNHFYKRKILLKNKTIKKDLNKIINKIIFR